MEAIDLTFFFFAEKPINLRQLPVYLNGKRLFEEPKVGFSSLLDLIFSFAIYVFRSSSQIVSA